jgi:DNA invertase Pin-like site-specific DNA recombinase
MPQERTKPTGSRGYCYVRTSKDDQDKRSQRVALERWLKQAGVEPLEWVEDSGPRDVSFKRAGIQRLLGLIQKRQVDWVVVSERDRLGYQDAWEYGFFIHTFRTNGAQLWSAIDNKELTGNTDRFEPILASLDADKSKGEQGGNADRCHRNKRAVVERGEWAGGKPPFGYDLVARERSGKMCWRLVYEPGQYRRVCHFPNGTTKRFDGKHALPGRDKGVVVYAERSLDPTIIAHVQDIFRWYAEGCTVGAIAKRLNREKVPALYSKFWLAPTVQKLIENPIYVAGVPVWNKSAHGRFKEFVGGEYVTVERVNGRAKAGRKRSPADYIMAPPRPENAIIDQATWDAAQARLRSVRAAPKTERRPRNPDLFLSGLVVCQACGKSMIGWAQQAAYRCSTNMRYTDGCRCNRTRHETLEELVLLYLEENHQALGFLYENPDHCREVLQLELASVDLVTAYASKLTALWRKAKATGQIPPADAQGLRVWTHRALRGLTRTQQPQENLAELIQAKESEKARLVRRLGLLADEDAATAVANRIEEITAELRELQRKAQPATDPLDALRGSLRDILERTVKARQAMAEAVPWRKGEYIRKVISQIRVKHEPRTMGTLRASRLVGVEIIPIVGNKRSYRDGEHFDAGHKDEPADWDGGPTKGPEDWRKCQNVVDVTQTLCDETLPGPG